VIETGPPRRPARRGTQDQDHRHARPGLRELRPHPRARGCGHGRGAPQLLARRLRHPSAVRHLGARRGPRGGAVRRAAAGRPGPEDPRRQLPGGNVELVAGEEVLLVQGDGEAPPGTIYIDYEYLEQDIQPGEDVLLADGLIRLHVIASDEDGLRARVKTGGMLGDSKGVAFPQSELRAPAVTEKDRRDLAFGRELEVDLVAASFVRSAADVREVAALAGPDTTDRRQDRARRRLPAPRRDPRGRAGDHGRPRRPRRAAAAAAHPADPARHPGAHQRCRGDRHHRHRDARVDDSRDAADPRRGHRRRQRGARRHRRGDALGRDGHRQAPGAHRRGDGHHLPRGGGEPRAVTTPPPGAGRRPSTASRPPPRGPP
jgi:hypothetical protein